MLNHDDRTGSAGHGCPPPTGPHPRTAPSWSAVSRSPGCRSTWASPKQTWSTHGTLLPTGHAVDQFSRSTDSDYPVTLIDAGAPVAVISRRGASA